MSGENDTTDSESEAQADDQFEYVDDAQPRHDSAPTTLEKPPAGAIASKDDFQHQRDGEGELIPVWEPIPGARTTCPNCDGIGLVERDADDTEDSEFDREACSACSGQGEVPQYAQVKPLTQGEARRRLPESGGVGNIDDAELVVLLDEFFLEPDFEIDRSRDPEDAIEDFGAFALEPLVMTLYNASGFDYTEGMLADSDDLLEAVEGNSRTGS